MPFKNKADKDAWRAKNAEKNRAYLAHWRANKIASDPGYLERERQREKVRRETAKAARPPKQPRPKPVKFGTCIVCRQRFERAAGRGNRCPTHEAWTCRVVDKLIAQLCRNWKTKDQWSEVAFKIGRVLRLMRERPRRAAKPREPLSCWHAAAKVVCASVWRDRNPSVGTWAKQANTICQLLKTRKGSTMGDMPKPKDILALLEKQQHRCAYTGHTLTPGNVSADHFVPVSEGGTHDIDNIRLVTRDVNRAKGAMPFADFVKMCKDVVAQHGE